MGEKYLQLQPRLQLLADLVPQGARLADIGTDHGYLPVWLLQRKRIAGAIAADIGEEPLQHARRTAEEYGVDGIEFRLCDGLKDIDCKEADTVVVAGMGGETIVGILDRGLKQIPVGTQFFLQPMTKVSSLRRYLYENGFCVLNEKLIFENDKFFIVIQAVYDGVLRSNLSAFYEFGEFLPKLNNIDSKKYFSSLLFSLESVIEGKKKANINFDEEIKRRKYLLHLFLYKQLF